MKLILASSFLLLSTLLFSQSYWQQEVNYTIQVKLNDRDHSLSAFESFEYINHSPNTLDFIYIHLWPNAYKNGNTALGKQLYADKEKELTFGHDSIRGWIDSLDFKINGQAAKWEYDPEHIDICKLYLSAPLRSGERITVSTPFKVKIPSGEISRLGHINQSYQITQWYPKPAVYDKNGWNQMPYLNQGEFYSEYGSFDVSITLPQNYVVGATGDLQTASELNFLNERFEQTKTRIPKFEEKAKKPGPDFGFPVSSQQWKTIRYTQKNVHDFAWFADKRFEVLRGEVELPHSKRKVTSWAMFTPQNMNVWRDAIEYINDGTYYYSLWNGDYPYNQVTAIDGTISAGGGMEYPNVTVIGNTNSKMDLEIVIVHEVGHNWFYGILGSNERVHGWMDEGLNTLNEMRYVETKYPGNKYLSDRVFGGMFHLNDLDHHDSGDIGFRFISILGEDQPLETHSADFTSLNYGLIMYQKTGLVFHYLKSYLGDELFNKTMQAYFNEWKFKHPQPEDLQASLEKYSGKKLDWLFEDLIKTTNHIDYKIKGLKSGENQSVVTLKNKGQVNGPIPVTVYHKGEKTTSWVETPGKGKSQLTFNFEIDSAQIDPDRQIPELNRSNNNWNRSWLFNKKEPLKLEFLNGDMEAKRSNNFWLPVIAGNSQDKLMLGLGIHNLGIPFKKYQYLLAPLYSFGRKNISGIGEFSLTSLPKRNFKLIRTGVSIKSFSNNDIRPEDNYYASVSPYIFMKLGQRKNATPFFNTLLLQAIYRYDQVTASKVEQAGAILKYNLYYDKPDFGFKLELRTDYMNNLQNANEMNRLMGETSFKYKYIRNKHNCWMELRLFAGTFLGRKLDPVISGTSAPYYNEVEYFGYTLALNGMSGAGDIFTEDYYFSRTGSNFGANQRAENMGNVKVNGNFGLTQKWLFAANYYQELPIKPKVLGIFADYGVFHNGTEAEPVFNTGIGIRLGTVCGFYFPVWMSKNLENSFGKNYYDKIRFSLKMNLVNQPIRIAALF
ncbi:MAG: hypothetical protein K0R65_2286 [Crocinitomicaceae bacterium]|nr:hypothetical protein [Crocinitomicaceae bacterium]